jgi:NAD(P)-dependent dehydrogenase (short-subunit alcohol dehydrogenase family)
MITCDLSSFSSIRAGAAQIVERWPRIDLLVNNAGVQHLRRTTTVDGIEETLAVNHLAPFLLTRLLMPALRAAPIGRVLTLSSELARWGRIDFDDLQQIRRYNGTRAYLQSKLANIMFTLSLARRFRGSAIQAACVYPGLVVTDLMRERWWWRSVWLRPLWRALFSTPNEAARTVVAAATRPTTDGCCFAAGGRAVGVPPSALDPAAQQRLWGETVRLVGVDF